MNANARALQHKCHKSHFHLSITLAEACLDGRAKELLFLSWAAISHCFVCVCLCVSVCYYFVLCFYFNDFSYHVAITYGPFWRWTTILPQLQIGARILYGNALDLYNFAGVTTMMHISFTWFQFLFLFIPSRAEIIARKRKKKKRFFRSVSRFA